MRKVNKSYWIMLFFISIIGVFNLYKIGTSSFISIMWLILIISCTAFGIVGLIKSIEQKKN